MERHELFLRLDRLASAYVRKRERRCATCRRLLTIPQRQAGHFIPRYVHATRWDRRNLHTQCAKCNVVLGGNLKEYQDFIRTFYGKETLEELLTCKRAYDEGRGQKMTTPILVALYNEWLEKVRETENYLGEMADPDWKRISLGSWYTQVVSLC